MINQEEMQEIFKAINISYEPNNLVKATLGLTDITFQKIMPEFKTTISGEGNGVNNSIGKDWEKQEEWLNKFKIEATKFLGMYIKSLVIKRKKGNEKIHNRRT